VSQRDSGYARKERDLYETPEWVTLALLPHLRELGAIWEPAAASGKMVRALEKSGAYVLGSDISDGCNFLTAPLPEGTQWDAVITNPPYELATEFIGTALFVMRPIAGLVAMLLRTDFDHAMTRQHLFAKHPAFSKKIVLTKRIKWFEDSKGQPSFNHAWFVWDFQHRGAPTLAYGP
jgi:hypothetical protein